MKRLSFAISLIALTTLMLELLLTRVFDVILAPHMAYMIITCAMFSFGLAGVYTTLRPPRIQTDIRRFLSLLSFMFAVSTIGILPVLNLLPFDYEQISQQPFSQIASFVVMYLVLIVPFFLSGLIFSTLFSAFIQNIQSLYFWDLAGAAVGCILLIPLIPPIGPGGLLFCASALGLFASSLFSPSKTWSLMAAIVGTLTFLTPFAHSPEYFEFREHLPKRGVKEAKEAGKVELTRWDAVSKIDVIDMTELDPVTQAVKQFSQKKHIAYDGGTQSSHIYPFDGDYKKLRNDIHSQKESVLNHFWQRGVLASHYLKRDTQQRVLILGSAGGQETKAALMYGAAHVDAVEMVKAVVELGKGKYAEYNGNIFNHPHVHVHVGEGRSFLRASSRKYDIIQIFSNHTSSSIAAGTGAMAPTYLQTADAYREYFEHLTENGILHVNHHIFPRMITTAALAWKWMGYTDFQKHVVVFERALLEETLPTLLVKMQPWTAAELMELTDFLAAIGEGELPFFPAQDPFNPAESFLSPAFFSGDFPTELKKMMDFRIAPATDEKPFFNFLRKKIREIEPDPEKFANMSTTTTLNSQLRRGIVPMDVIHLIVTGAVSLFFAGIFIVLPLCCSHVGKTSWRQKYPSMLYFSCLGIGFILIEMVFIQIFMKLIGFPVYTYSVVIFALLFAAGLGSSCSERLKMTVKSRWTWPFIGILSTGSLFVVVYPYIFHTFLAAPTLIRIMVASLMIFPLGFFLGMPFPLGILALEKQPNGAVAWAWGLNGLFTVIGGLASVVLSIFVGFTATLLVALCIYVLAFLTFSAMRAGSVSMAVVNGKRQGSCEYEGTSPRPV